MLTVNGNISLYFSFILLPVVTQVQYNPKLCLIFKIECVFDWFVISQILRICDGILPCIKVMMNWVMMS